MIARFLQIRHDRWVTWSLDSMSIIRARNVLTVGYSSPRSPSAVSFAQPATFITTVTLWRLRTWPTLCEDILRSSSVQSTSSLWLRTDLFLGWLVPAQDREHSRTQPLEAAAAGALAQRVDRQNIENDLPLPQTPRTELKADQRGQPLLLAQARRAVERVRGSSLVFHIRVLVRPHTLVLVGSSEYDDESLR